MQIVWIAFFVLIPSNNLIIQVILMLGLVEILGLIPYFSELPSMFH